MQQKLKIFLEIVINIKLNIKVGISFCCKIKDFNTPVIVMLKENKEQIKEHYIEDGFKDYLLIKDFKNETNRIIEKY